MTVGDITATVPDPSRGAHEAFLAHLAYSTGSLEAILRLAASVNGPSARFRPPASGDLNSLREQVVELPHLEALIQRAWRRSIESFASSNDTASESDSKGALCPMDPFSTFKYHEWDRSSGPPHRVPATPWTTITSDDEAVSHLVSIFLAWINPSWRFVLPDLFLRSKFRSVLLDGLRIGVAGSC